jgi:hypothetical protein
VSPADYPHPTITAVKPPEWRVGHVQTVYVNGVGFFPGDDVYVGLRQTGPDQSPPTALRATLLSATTFRCMVLLEEEGRYGVQVRGDAGRAGPVIQVDVVRETRAERWRRLAATWALVALGGLLLLAALAWLYYWGTAPTSPPPMPK